MSQHSTALYSDVLAASGARATATVATSIPPETQVLIVGVFAGADGLELPIPPAGGLSEAQVRWLLDALSAVRFSATLGATTHVAIGTDPAPDYTVLAVGLGDPEQLDDEALRRASGAALRQLGEVDSVATALGHYGLAPAIEGAILGAYDYPGLRADKHARPIQVWVLASDDSADTQETAAAAVAGAEAVCFTRDLVNTPSNLLYPENYAQILATVAQRAGVDCEVLGPDELDSQGFGGVVAVGQGSAHPPRVVRLSWKPQDAQGSTVALVGKGITFDTGGISLKRAAKMEDMISDMGGSAAAAATVFAAAARGLKVAVTATLPLAENMPSGSATRPGDVITHYGGTTSEVINTDAEGRLVLADALARASEDEPDFLLDTATLTGAQIVALGDRTAGVMGTERLRDEVARLGREVGENAWAMPLVEEHLTTVVSPIADIRNSPNSRSGGMLYAGTYLSKFVAEGIEWAHVDIAGPSWNEGSAYGYTPKRASGVPVRTFLAFLEKVAAGEFTAED
ncbi:leucyl aminopeptidase [Corynebacterium uberis]|uniref:leucyl aminopeptidase n=1 Tax=Corynebacterium uberis TaxID=2883169 RepID=UPI00237C8C68|nr:leucyl aminopeptidase [Corynebacterium sp. c6VSa_13]